MKTNRCRSLFQTVIIIMLLSAASGIFAQDSDIPVVPDNADVMILGGGGSPIDIPSVIEKIENGSGWDDFGTVYSAAGDLTISLRDVYIANDLTVITMAFGTDRSANNHVTSEALYVNGEQRAGGGEAGEASGEPFENTMTFVFYGGMPDAKPGRDWDSLRVSFEGLVLAAYEGSDSGYLGTPNGYRWSYVFHNPAVSHYNDDGFASTMDESGIHTLGSHVEIELNNFTLDGDGDLDFDIVEKSDRLNLYGSSNSIWINDQHSGGGGKSVPFDGDGNPDFEEDEPFVSTSHFLYQQVSNLSHPVSLAVWARSVTFELTRADASGSWISSLSEENFPMKIVQFYNIG